MTQKWTRVSRRMLFTWCLLGGLICLFAPPSLTSKLQLAYTYAFRWPLQAGRGISLHAPTLSSLRDGNSPGAEAAAAEQQRLKNHIANLEAQLKEARQEIDRLGRIHAVPQWDRMSFLPADITLPSATQDILFINRGQKDGVAVGQYVLGDMSVIGVVASVSPRSAKVRLITDPDSKIPVTIGESNLDRVMDGHIGNLAKIGLVRASEPVAKGTRVYAKKVPGRLDAPIIAGRVAQCRPDPENPSLLDITVEPACDIAGLSSVAVIVSAPKP
jgi:cell shape-determining protein MreC